MTKPNLRSVGVTPADISVIGLNVQAILYWTSKEDFERCYALGIPEVHEDLKHYTNGMPTRWIGSAVLNG